MTCLPAMIALRSANGTLHHSHSDHPDWLQLSMVLSLNLQCTNADRAMLAKAGELVPPIYVMQKL